MNWKMLTLVLGTFAFSAVGCGVEADSVSDEGSDDGDPIAETTEALRRGRVSVPPAKREFTVPFTVSIQGAGTKRVGALSVTSPAGTTKIHDHDFVTVTRAVTALDPWTIYQAEAVNRDAMYHVWYYCYGTRLLYAWVIGTDGAPGEIESAQGTCTAPDATPSAARARIKLPRIKFDYPAPIANLVIDGSDVSYSGTGPGTLLGEVLLPFNYRSQSTGKFVEALAYNPSVPRVRLVELELLAVDGAPNAVRLRTTLGFNDLSPPGPATDLSATWSAP